MGGPAVARGRGRLRKVAVEQAEPSQQTGVQSSSSNQDLAALEFIEGSNPNSPVLGNSQSPSPTRLSWASIVQGPPSHDQSHTLLQASSTQHLQSTKAPVEQQPLMHTIQEAHLPSSPAMLHPQANNTITQHH
ncbi:unnamed protein product [Amaranthus hypochondriacus]